MVVNEVVLDAWKNNYIIVYARKGEINARSILAAFEKENGEYLDLSGKSVTFYASKPDGTKVYNNCTLDSSNTLVSVNLTSQMVSVAGIVNCEYQVFCGDTLLLKISGLKLVVEDGGDFSEAVESSSEYNTLIHAINEAETFTDSVGSVNDLTTSNKSNLVAAINEVNGKTIPISKGGTGGITQSEARTNLGVLTRTQLYYNTSGTLSTIQLASNISNFLAIEIFYMDDDHQGKWCNSLKIYNNYQSSYEAVLNSSFAREVSGDINIKLFSANVYVSGSSVTWGYAKMATLKPNNVVTLNDLTQYQTHKIYRIDGYKY